MDWNVVLEVELCCCVWWMEFHGALMGFVSWYRFDYCCFVESGNYLLGLPLYVVRGVLNSMDVPAFFIYIYTGLLG